MTSNQQLKFRKLVAGVCLPFYFFHVKHMCCGTNFICILHWRWSFSCRRNSHEEVWQCTLILWNVNILFYIKAVLLFSSNSVHKVLLSIKWNKKRNMTEQRETGLVSEQGTFGYWLLFWCDWLSRWQQKEQMGKTSGSEKCQEKKQTLQSNKIVTNVWIGIRFIL